LSDQRLLLRQFSVPLVLLLSICSLLGYTPTTLQQRAQPVIENAIYEKTLDLLFPEGESLPKDIISVTVLRFEPSFAPESEIVLKETFETSEIVFYKATEGNIYQRLNALVQGAVARDPESLAKKVEVSTKRITSSRTLLRKWNSAMFEDLRLSTKTLDDLGERERAGTASFPLDGTVYILKYCQGTSTLSLKLYDVEIDRPNATPQFRIVQWMNTVRDYVNSH
jgi:hypothetical protein